eukprot:COSAG01_NODE_4786_length_4745_cov_95.210073_7_plen_144_part_00
MERNATGPQAWPSKLPFNVIPASKLIMSPHVASRSEHDRVAREEVSRQLEQLAHSLSPVNIVRPGAVGYWPTSGHEAGRTHKKLHVSRMIVCVVAAVALIAAMTVSFVLGRCYERRKWKAHAEAHESAGFTDDERRRLVECNE